MKILHIGNMVGDSFYNVKFLRERGIEADLVIDPGGHVTDHPQWNEGEFDGTVDEYEPKWNEIQVGGYVPPPWLKYSKLGVYFRPRGLISTLRRFNLLVRDYDIIQAAVLEPINCFLSGVKPYISYSKGSDLRDIPFEDTIRGRLMAIALKRSSKVFITNPDTFSSAWKLGLRNAIYVPFIIDSTVFRPEAGPLRQSLQDEYGFNYLIANPSRQDWRDKGSDKLIRAYASLVKAYPNTLLAMVEWGVDVARSKQLVYDLGLEKRVIWLPLMNKRKLLKLYNACDIVFDHINLESYGTTPLEAMACEKPVIAKLPNKEIAERCWGDDLPPLINLDSEPEILQTLRMLVSDDSLRKGIGRKSRDWVIKHHDWRVAVEKHIEAYSSILG